MKVTKQGTEQFFTFKSLVLFHGRHHQGIFLTQKALIIPKIIQFKYFPTFPSSFLKNNATKYEQRD